MEGKYPIAFLLPKCFFLSEKKKIQQFPSIGCFEPAFVFKLEHYSDLTSLNLVKLSTLYRFNVYFVTVIWTPVENLTQAPKDY